MSLFFPTSEFFEDSGKAVNKFNEDLRDGIAGFSCDLWAIYPDFITQGTNPLSSFARGYMNQMCSPRQSPVPAPSPPFSGGQCPGVRYTVRIRWLFDNGSLYRLLTFDVFGPVESIVGFFEPGVPSQPNGAGLAKGEVRAFTQSGLPRLYLNDGSEQGPPQNPPSYEITPFTPGTDICGNPGANYTSPSPTVNDLSTTINIINLDGTSNTYSLEYNKISNQYNFPIGFKLNGINVTLDIGGITIHGSPTFVSPNSDNDIEPPGSDGGKDGDNKPYVRRFPNTDYPVLPDFNVPDVVTDTIERIVCDEGILQIVTETVVGIPAIAPIYKLIILILGEIISEICGNDSTSELGFPEYYPVIPGTERPAVVLAYKEVVDGMKGRSTYTTTITHPSASFIANFDTVEIPDKRMGKYVISVTLTDGSRLRVSGETETEADLNFQALLGLVRSSFIPDDLQSSKVVTFYEKLQVKDVKCVQLAFYPNGRAAGVAPELLRTVRMEE